MSRSAARLWTTSGIWASCAARMWFRKEVSCRDAGGFVGRKKSSPLSPKAMMRSGCAFCHWSSCSGVGAGFVVERYVGCVPAEQKTSGCFEYVLQISRRVCCCGRDVAMERRIATLALFWAELAFSRIVSIVGRDFFRGCCSRKKSRWQWESTRENVFSCAEEGFGVCIGIKKCG